MNLRIILIAMFSLLSLNAQAVKPVVLLVPGFFNSLTAGYIESQPPEVLLDIEPYFSIDIIRALRAQGMETVVVNNLAPVGTLEGNGERLISFIKNLQKNPRYQGRSFDIIAHSAGGLYSLYALSNMPGFSVRHFITIATPFKGVEFVDKLGRIPLLPNIMNLIELRSIPELRPPRVAQFLAKLKVPENLSVHAIAPIQKLKIDITNGENLSWPLAAISPLISEDSDGVIGVSSALGSGVRLKTVTGKSIGISMLSQGLSLEHWEQVMDYRCFTLLGVRNVSVIRRHQVELFEALEKALK